MGKGERPTRSVDETGIARTVDEVSDVRPLVFMSDYIGGTASHVFALIREWARSGVPVDLVTKDARSLRLDLPASVHHLPPISERLDRFPFAQLVRFRQVARLLRSRRPNVVHTYFFWPIMYGRLLKLVGLVPHLVENREDLGFDWRGPQYRMLRATAAIPDRVICVSEAVRELVVRKEGLPRSRTVVLRNGIPKQREPPQRSVEAARSRLGLEPEHLVVTVVANFQRPVKGLEYFIASGPLITEAVPEARLLVVGEGPDRYRREAADRGLADRIIFAGRLPRNEIDAIYALTDVSVSTSLSEGLSITILESMAHGVPVVATRVGGNPEVVREGTTGYLVPARDSAASADRIVSLLRNPEKRQRMGRAARELVSEDFSVSKVASEYLRVYRDVLDAGGRNDGKKLLALRSLGQRFR